MSFNFLNGIEVGKEPTSGLGYSWGMQHAKRLIYLWLKKVVGWTEIDIKGNGSWGSSALWDAPIVSVLTDGATDATNARKFTSATAAFVSSGVVAGDLILVRPTAAPATAGGFADAKRNGFYKISSVVSETEIRVHTWYGVHTDGLSLGETGLTFEVHRFNTSALMPIDEDQVVLAGTGTGGTFHMRMRNDRNVNYGGGWLWEVSPWADWLVGSHAWSAAPARHTNSTTMNAGVASTDDLVYLWGFADLTQFFIVSIGYDVNGNRNNRGVVYCGDIDAFHPGVDTRPVVVMHGKDYLTDMWQGFSKFNGVQQIASDDLTLKEARLSYLGVNQNNNSPLLEDSVQRSRSWYSGRWIRMPVLVTEEDAGFEEIRGQLKSIWRTHEYGPQSFTPVGASLEWLRIGNLLMPWNGSKQFRYIP